MRDEQSQADGLIDAANAPRADYTGLTSTIQELIRLMREGNVERLDVKQGDLKISIASRESPATLTPHTPALLAGGVATTNPSAAVDEASLHVIKSPMIGTYYAASAPTEPPFVVEGDRIEAGQTVAIIEAMKTMNEIQSEVSGVVEAILVKNADPVEYGHPLMRVRIGPSQE